MLRDFALLWQIFDQPFDQDRAMPGQVQKLTGEL